LGGNISTSGGVSVSGGQLILSGANTYTGGNSISGGTLQLGSATALGRYNNNLSMSGGTVDINGQGGLTVGRLSGTTGTITDNATSAGGSAFSTSSNLDSTFGGSIADGTFRRLSLQKDGSGTLTLTGTNTYTGSTLVSAGKLLVNGSLVSNLTTVANGAVLGGSGSLGAVSLNSGSSISPGNSPGLLTTNGNLTSTGGSFVMEIAGTTPVTQYDQLAVNGDIDLGSTSVLTLSFSAAPAVGDKFFLLLNNGTNPILGSFSGLNEGDQFTSSGYTFSAHYGADSSTGNLTGGNDFAIYTVVPEPSGMLMLLLTTSALTLRRRRRTA
jgi:autotransporter-associated beta strand protein